MSRVGSSPTRGTIPTARRVPKAGARSCALPCGSCGGQHSGSRQDVEPSALRWSAVGRPQSNPVVPGNSGYLGVSLNTEVIVAVVRV